MRTPDLDRLAARGTRRERLHPFPICVPARACLATGRYAHQLGIWDNGAPYTGREVSSWGHRLTARGRQVTTIGKLHYRDAGTTPASHQRLPMHVLDGVGDVFGPWWGDSLSALGSVRCPGAGGRAGGWRMQGYDWKHAEAERWLHEHAGSPLRRPLGPSSPSSIPTSPCVSPSRTATSLSPNPALPRCGTGDLVDPPRHALEATHPGHRGAFPEPLCAGPSPTTAWSLSWTSRSGGCWTP